MMKLSLNKWPNMNCSLLLFILLVNFGCAPAQSENKSPSYPKAIYIIRHGEKLPPESMSIHLSDKGNQRAEAIPHLFEKSENRPEPLSKPDFLFAAKNSMKSHRPNETIAPFAKSVNMKVHDHYDDEESEAFAKHLLTTPKYAGKILFVSWRHTATTLLAKKLGVSNPPKWPDETFDRIWEITFDDAGKASLKNLPQKLLPGDSEK